MKAIFRQKICVLVQFQYNIFHRKPAGHRPMACFTKEVNPSLANQPLKFKCGLTKLVLTFLVGKIGHKCTDSCDTYTISLDLNGVAIDWFPMIHVEITWPLSLNDCQSNGLTHRTPRPYTYHTWNMLTRILQKMFFKDVVTDYNYG